MWKNFNMRLLKLENKKQMPWVKNPTIGWWLDQAPTTTFYHGTHSRNLEGIMENGIYAPTSDPTANWVSLALELNTAHGYASMSGAGGESEFRSAGAKTSTTSHAERTVFVLELPQSYFLTSMAPARGNMDDTRDKLTNRSRYDEWVKSGKTDQEYYQLTEIRIAKHVPAKYIVGYMKKK